MLNLILVLCWNVTVPDVLFRSIFPNGLPSEYSLVSIWRVRRTTKKDRWYLWQIFDQSGGSQVSANIYFNCV